MSVRADYAVRHYQQRYGEANSAISWFTKVAEQTKAAGRRAKKELNDVSVELAAAYLPGLTAAPPGAGRAAHRLRRLQAP